MGDIVTVSGKIPVEQKEKLRRYGVNVSRLIQEAVDREIRGIEEEEVRRALEEAAVVLRKIPDEHIVEAIRAGRDER
jgi:post-segregation antitoxin (ccd killing protein)